MKMNNITEKNNHTWCVNAENNLSIGTDGGVRVCCVIDDAVRNEKGEIYNARTTSFSDIFNSAPLQTLRDNLRNGIQDPLCKKCWDDEACGKKSKRLRDLDRVNFQKEDEFLNFEKNTIKFIELSLGNTCNLKCRMCGPWSSNQWAREYYDTRYKDKISWEEFLSDNQQYSSLYDTESYFWENIHSILKDVVHLDFYGGEPFLIKKHWDLIEQCVNNGYSQNKTLHYTTNATIWPEKYIHLLKNFNCVYINLSLDAIQDKANYIRYPSKWEEVDVIVNKWYVFAMNHPNIHINICYTVTPYNVYYVDEMIQYLESLNKKYESNMIDLKDIFLNTVHKPNYYDIRFMPLYLKENIFSKLEQGAEKNKPLNNLLNYMMSESYNKNYWNQFKYYTKMSDEYRNQSFQKIFPELYSLIFNKEVF